MSGTGNYKIQSLIEKEPSVGARFIGPPPPIPILSVPVRINVGGTWRLTQQGDSNVYQFSISFFGSTGVSETYVPDKKTVTVSTGDINNKLWYVDRVGHEEYIIALADDRAIGWTVYGLDPDSNIVLERLPPLNVQNETLPNPFYHLFKLTKLEE